MTWLAWRQFRAQALVGLAGLAAAVAYLIHTGLTVRDARSASLARCEDPAACAQAAAGFVAQFENTFLFLAGGLYLVPIAVGLFWGAPLVSGELEAGTHKLVWSQGVTRRRWLLTRVGLLAAAGIVVVGILSATMTWAAHPLDDMTRMKFDTIIFGARDLAPVAYCVFAIALGVFLGVLTRRRLPAMALTGLVVLVTLFAFPNVVRPHLLPPKVENRAMTAEAVNEARSMGSITGAPVLGGLTVPHAWVSGTSPLLTASGAPLAEPEFNRCLSSPPKAGGSGTFGDTAVCLEKLDLHITLQYQPDGRYWTFQGLESGSYALAGGLLIAVAGWRLRRVA